MKRQKQEYLSKLKDLILEEEKKVIKFDIETPSLTKRFQKYPIPHLFNGFTNSLNIGQPLNLIFSNLSPKCSQMFTFALSIKAIPTF